MTNLNKINDLNLSLRQSAPLNQRFQAQLDGLLFDIKQKLNALLQGTKSLQKMTKTVQKNLKNKYQIKLSDNVKKALEIVDRTQFVPDIARAYSYHNTPLSIGLGQTISSPETVALMAEFLEIEGHEDILEIGSGSGYNASVLACLTNGKVIGIERLEALLSQSRRNLQKAALPKPPTLYGKNPSKLQTFMNNRPYKHKDKLSPNLYDKIQISCALQSGDEALPYLEKLKPNGIMIAPFQINEKTCQYMIYKESTGWQSIDIETHFVPHIQETTSP